MFKALGDKTRLRIVLMLKVKPICVCEIREIIGTSLSTISNHLERCRNI
ncbi:MAG TPA: ArsR family transcriptional regulator [Candidatus Cloacimonetes bacterium]|nr:ArsR family transcriptional regulator [Candidatus Cloacimonadota bacterium]